MTLKTLDYNNMPIKQLNFSAFVMISLLTCVSTLAQEKEAKRKAIPEPKSFTTTGQGEFGGSTIAYRATAKETYLKNKEGEPVTSIWSVAYTVDSKNDVSQRPVTFVFNGGPGSASV